MPGPTERIVAVDVYRGLVMLLLLPDPEGGFSFYRMAAQFPDSSGWRALSQLFTHVPWSGCSIWDLIMPSFVLLAGAAMPLSAAARAARGESKLQIATHFALRSCLLLLLAFMLHIPHDTVVRELSPLLLLLAVVPVPSRLATRAGVSAPYLPWVDNGYYVVVLILGCLWLYANWWDLGNYKFNNILSQLGLASIGVSLIVGRPRSVQLGVALALLVFWWLLFALYPLLDGGQQIYSGFFAHWNKNANVGTVFDVWFLNLLPRTIVYVPDSTGLTTLNFVPTMASMIIGVMTGDLLGSSRPRAQVRNILLAAGAIGIVVGIVASQWLCPLVKSVWTPTWVLFSSGICLLVLGGLFHLCDIVGARRWAWPFAALGTSAILVYTLCLAYRWRLLSIPQHLLGADVFSGPYGPLWESAAVAALLCSLAFVLFRLRISVRI